MAWCHTTNMSSSSREAVLCADHLAHRKDFGVPKNIKGWLAQQRLNLNLVQTAIVHV